MLALVQALAEAHSPAAFAHAVQVAFGAKRVELCRGDDVWTAVAGRPVAHGRRAGGEDAVRIVPTVKLSPLVRALFASSLKHIDVVGRVAELSRRAHGDASHLQRALNAVVLPEGVVAVSAAMRDVLQVQVPLVARRDTTVLLRGETGTGKEVVARRIHALSARAGRPMLTVNCGALPETLIESALFGHERGAFTGAQSRHLGFFECAHGSTLFLDEVAELPLSAQVKLLRVLQEGELTRVGGERTVRVDVRVIAATHRPLEALVVREAFRADLFYRLDVFPIRLPPLRERADDIGPLVTAFLARRGAKLRVPPKLLARLRRHAWPGNVRELENVLERAVLTSTGDVLEVPPLPETAVAASRRRRTGTTFDDAQRAAIEAALEASGGKVFGPDGAAFRLGLRPTTLQSKMKRLGW